MVTIGADPEVLIRDGRTGQAHPICGILGGTKGKAIPMADMPKGYAIQEDNVMAEYNIPPQSTGNSFATAVLNGLDYVERKIKEHAPYLELDIGSCSRLFTDDQLSSPQAQTFGCSPDFNAHAGGLPCTPIDRDALREQPGAWRFAGGHVHIGYTAPEVPEYVVAAFADVFLGLAAVDLDQQGRRRQLYGSAGRYRPTPYGIEYRTLSNFWVFHRNLAATIGSNAIRLGLWMQDTPASEVQRIYGEVPWSDVEAAINNEDSERAADLLCYCRNDLSLEV